MDFIKTFKNGAMSFLWQLFFAKDKKKLLLFGWVLLCSFISALLDGLSFSVILFALSVLGGDGGSIGKLPILSHLPFHDYFLTLSANEIFGIFIILAISLQALRSGTSYIAQVFLSLLSNKVRGEVQKKVYRHVLNLSFPCVSRYKVGELTEFANTPIIIIGPVTDAINRIIVSVLTIGALIAVMFMMSISLTVIMLSLFLFLGLLQQGLLKKMSKVSGALADYVTTFNKHIVQSLNGIRVIYTFNRQADMQHKIHDTIDKISASHRTLEMLNYSVNPINEIIGISLVGACLVIGPYLLSNQSELPVLPILLTFITITYRLASRVHIAMGGLSSLISVIGPILKLKEFLREDNKEFSVQEGKLFPGLKNQIEFKEVSLRYRSEQGYAVKNLSIVLPKGKTLAFVGTSGAGKSSIIDLVLRLYEPSSGSIIVDGVDLHAFNVGSWRDKLGVVSQDTFIFNDSIEENIRFGSTVASDDDVISAAKAAGALEFIQKLPEGFETVLGERGYRLSGGERQRIALARALLRNPEVLILDEATSNLDSHSEFVIQKALDVLQKERTVIVIAHRLSTIMKADQIVVLDQGKLIEAGTHQELLQMNGKYAHFWNIQSQKVTEKNSEIELVNV